MSAKFLGASRIRATTFGATFHFRALSIKLLKLGARRRDLVWQFRITRIELQCPLVSAQRIPRPAGIHITVTYPAETEQPAQLFTISIRGERHRRFISTERIIVTLQA